MIPHPSKEDMISIVKAQFPDLDSIASQLIETFDRVNQLVTFQFGASGSVSRFSLRDLMKLCKRVADLGFKYDGDGLSDYVCNCIYLEAVDVFASFSTSGDNRMSIMKEITMMWKLPAAESLYPLSKPVIQEMHSDLCIGRITLQRTQTPFRNERKPFVELRSSIHVLEKIACSVKFNEPVLLVGETGTGKTTLVQSLATRLGQRLTVLNLSQQSDVADLLGGFKPTDAHHVCIPLYNQFESLYNKTFKDEEFLIGLKKFVNAKKWKMLLRGFQKCGQKVLEIVAAGAGQKRKRHWSEELVKAWEDFSLQLGTANSQINDPGGMIFSFVEGAFVNALRNGEWILLDEVNLAPPETLQRIIGVLEEESGSLCLAERGDINYVERHPNFRIFACMNPATDAGKRDLPYSLRSRFTEFFVDDLLDDGDLILFINQFMDDEHSDVDLVNRIVQFYKAAKKESEEKLQDGANQKPQYSLRSLYRALEYTKKAKRNFGFQKAKDSLRALYDGFCMFFLTLLDEPSSKLIRRMIVSHLLGGKMPSHVSFADYLMIKENITSDSFSENYVLTKSVREHLGNLARAIFVGRYPVLLQGPTSSGKTSLVQYLAAITGNEFVRINNHEHTDLQEYLGSYITDASGRLVFQEGVLVKAVRNGHWIVLDELNLAPSDVLEALNRLLDDNRELFVPELHETVRAHPNFLLFATQNPPTLYGGRKMLSRAFRNRFVEIHVDEIPEEELSTILEKRCKIPESYAKKMVEVMKELQLRRQSSKIFAGKHGFITPRDLFRWADRFRAFGNSYEDLARDGYFLLAERLRDDSEKIVVQQVLQKQLRVNLVTHDLYNQDKERRDQLLNLCKDKEVMQSLGRIAWTESMWRLYFLIERCHKMREPVLLVGETGGGKTTVCQLLSLVLGSKLHILNCHQYTETSDFLGGYYPMRERSRIASEFRDLCEQIMQSKAFLCFPDSTAISTDINHASSITSRLAEIVKNYKQGLVSRPDVIQQDIVWIEQSQMDLVKLHHKWHNIFMWQDGPLVEAMKNGDLFLVDEISLADDSVLERLNSVLEPERKLALAEKGGPDLEKITAHPNFFLLATMNPGGDYGKKELSPALRNRFTEIWVPPVNDANELKTISLSRISSPQLSCIIDPMLIFWEWFNQLHIGRVLTVRDLLSWIAFINATEENLQPTSSCLHGAFLMLLDGLSLGTGISKEDAGELRERCLSFLLEQLKIAVSGSLNSNALELENYGWADLGISGVDTCGDQMQCDNLFGIHPFYIAKGNDACKDEKFDLLAPTTRRNALRVLRALQLSKPVLLEGSPGVGKTSLIVALGKFSRHSVVRINLSEQTDMMDLLGSDLPVESDDGVRFSWSDGILLQAIKNGSWVLLDELNLAPQSVLEGLNAILDHRSEVFIPELGVTFKCPPSFRVFACQNPSYQGGGRKGLPKSFLNRFTKVYVDELVEDDYLSICSASHPTISRDLLSKLILFNKRLHEETMVYHKFAQVGSPWEFNLRDMLRSCQIIEGTPEISKTHCFLNTVYIQRMRTASDREKVVDLYEEVFGVRPFLNPYPRIHLSPQYLVVGNACIKRNHLQSKVSKSELKILPVLRHSLESVAVCVQHKWLCILVGPPSSGKTSVIRVLSQLTGNVLNELSLSSASDISDLLGGFEQYNAFRHYQLVFARVESLVNEYCSLELEGIGKEFISRRKNLLTRWLAFSSNVSCGPANTLSYGDDWKDRAFASLPLLKEIIEQIKNDINGSGLSLSWSCKDLNRTLRIIEKLSEDYKRGTNVAKFEWVTGVLIKAIENGEWIVLENSNLCNPTVLDRINSLVEPQGEITVNECGNVDGKPLVLHPHPQFRIFLTVDPNYGDISRAMRNRGMEICLLSPYWLLDGANGEICNDMEVKDVKTFLALSGIPLNAIVNSMATAHRYAKVEGMQLNVRITYLELGRWVHLFQQLLARGNPLVWSLQLSWEHTYLSSLGEAEGKFVVNYAITSYLSGSDLYKSESSSRCYLCLPGGWPTPKTVRNYVWHSREANVRQNCMYLDFLVDQALCVTQTTGNYQMDMKRLQITILIAANWVIEQATENDLDLYLLWFGWFAPRLKPLGNFFSSYLKVLSEELKHSIWNKIRSCRQKLLSHHQLDVDSRPIPILSAEMADLFEPNDVTISASPLLNKAISCVGVLRTSLQQWHTEAEFSCSDRNQGFQPVLEALRKLEEKVIGELVESSHFDMLFLTYVNLLEDHISFWEGVKSKFEKGDFEKSLISWRSLMKNALKLLMFFPKEVANLQAESNNLEKVLPQRFHSQKSLLWVHGGHPYVPSSADLYQKQQQLLNLCQSTWLRNVRSWRKVNDDLVEAVVSFNPELRSIAVQGICMSSYILGDDFDYESRIIQQLEEMYQMLLKRINHEKKKLETVLGGSTKDTVPVVDSGAACIFSPTMLCTVSGFDSWLDTVLVNDNTSFFLDMELLQELSLFIIVDTEESRQALLGLSGILESALGFMLNFSSRHPTDILAHQKILWALQAWTSADAEFSRIASFVLEMWFSWHSTMWTQQHASAKRTDGSTILLPDMLFKPIRTETIYLILRSTFAIKDYHVHRSKLTVGSRNLWHCYPSVSNVQGFLLSAARCLFQQIIYAHRKSFEADKYAVIKFLLHSSQKNKITDENLEVIFSLLSSSRHSGLASAVDSLIKPVLRDLYGQIFPTGTSTLGCAWLRIGALRYRLLITCDDLDPALKYSCKYLKLVDKIKMLELENEVRKESTYLAGGLSTGEIERQKLVSLESLKAECEMLKRKITFRSDPGKFVKLKSECDEFLNLVVAPATLIKDGDIRGQICSWQETATCFVDRLSSEYSAYADIIQPVQVAIYEIKLGLSLVLSGAMQKEILNMVGSVDMERVMESVHSFMKYPRVCESKTVSVEINFGVGNSPSYLIDYPTSTRSMDMNWNLLEHLVTSAKDGNSDDTVSPLHSKISLHHNFLVRIAQSVSEAQLMDNSCFTALDKIFGEFASLWMNMKDEVKTKQEDEAQQYKFRPRAFKIESIIELDISTLGNSLENETLSEWQELLSEEDALENIAKVEDDNLEAEWNVMQDSIMNNVVHIHNQVFGSKDLIHSPGMVQISEAEELSSFIDSYSLGVRMIKGLEGLVSADLDVKLTPEHFLRLCLEHEKKFNNALKSARAYNFYKDSNAPVMANMVERVTALQKKILSLLAEMEDHPAILKILNVIEMILAIPLSTPLAKALSGLQFLVNRVQVLQETVSKFPLSDVLEPIFHLIASWQKLEFESWPALLDEVQVQFENNAAKLWFPLYSVLQQRHFDDGVESIIRSLEEFIQTSSVGEFQKRLQLLLAFYGAIRMGICRGFYISCHEKTVKVLYNLFGFYVQHLPNILEHVEKTRKDVETELKELLKLCRWDRPESYVSIESSKRTRLKFRKLVQKYTDLLQQPILLLINQGAPRGTQSLLPQPKSPSDSFDKDMKLLNIACDQALKRDNDRPTWFIKWCKNVDYFLQNFHLEQIPESKLSDFTFAATKEIESIIGQCLASVTTCPKYQEDSKQLWSAIEIISRTAIDCANLWKDDNKSLGKRRALANLLKLLESCGLNKHRSYAEDNLESSQSKYWLLQPSYDIGHLLRSESELSIEDVFFSTEDFQSLPIKTSDLEWGVTNGYYFKSIASFNLLKQICLNFHKDFILEQVQRSESFLDHLLAIQQEQRDVSYNFAEKLNRLRKYAILFKHVFGSVHFEATTGSHCSFSLNPFATYKCMWQQKQIFDSLCSMAHEVCLLLRTSESAHLDTCESVKVSASEVRAFVEKFTPEFQKSKDMLDSYLVEKFTPEFQKSKDLVETYLVGQESVRASVTSPIHPNIITKQMEQLVCQNFRIIHDFEEKICDLRRQDKDRRSVKEVLLGRFKDIFIKVNKIQEDFECAFQERDKARNTGEDICCNKERATELGTEFGAALEGVYKHILGAFHTIGSNTKDHALPGDSVQNITMSKDLFISYVSKLKLDDICEAVLKTLDCAGKLVNHHGEGSHHFCLIVEVHLKLLNSLLDLIVTFSNYLLREFLNFHGTVSVITHALSNIFSRLYSEGFGIPNEEQEEDTCKTKEAKGTGMGEGAGLDDVSDQITDEDQLLGTSEKQNEEKDELNDVPSKKDKGIEMEQDFEADTFSVSEDSGDDNDEDEETPELDPKMGETGPDGEAMDEKLRDKDDEEDPDSTKDKYETGPSVDDKDAGGRELRAKDESDAASPSEPEELNLDKSDKQDIDEHKDEDGLEGTEDMKDMNIDKAEAYAEPTGLNVDGPNEKSEDINMDEPESVENMEDAETEEVDETKENDNGEDDKDASMDEGLEEKVEQVGGENGDTDEDEDDANKEKTETGSALPKEDVLNPPTYDVPDSKSGTQPKGDTCAADLRDAAPKSEEAKWSSSNDLHNDLAPTRGMPNASDMEVMLPDSSEGGKITDDQPQTQPPQHNPALSQKTQPNPLRDIGNALEEWKERVKVATDLQEKNAEDQDEIMNEEEADEYGYTTEFDKGTTQALGAATAEQMDNNFDAEKPDGDGKMTEREEMPEGEVTTEESETGAVKSAPNFRKKVEEQMEIQKLEQKLKESGEAHGPGKDNEEMSENLVSVNRSYMTEDIHQLGRLSLHDSEMRDVNNLEEVSAEVKDNATVLWRKYELLTTRLSQELAEQLRLVMEPTLASKLQGDYKTGKRINMKKVIPYIASHYRKDKIWLRRTRPNKRNYQVVIAVDDSGSMSENRCGDVAIEALVTVCRAMSQLEVGDMAVASFGKGGNIRLLHEFDRPFTGESGVKMISNLTFKQENTIADAPVGDLLKCVNNLLDDAVAKARLPSGQNPLQQLVLIIADGSFHEENLKKHVRDVLSKKRMVAFILLDSKEESIMDRKKVTIRGGNVEFSRYMDSFPFPYYIVLRNVEALPRTLADLLRQWFELMQNSRE